MGHWNGPFRKKKLSWLYCKVISVWKKKRHPHKHAAFIMQRYAELSKKAAQDNPELIVWPEAATPGLVLKHAGLFGQLRKLIRDQGTFFLIGSSEFPKFNKEKKRERRPGNTALYFSPKGKVLGQYLKIRLLPFGEYIPFEKTFPWPSFIYVDTTKNWEIPGDEATRTVRQKAILPMGVEIPLARATVLIPAITRSGVQLLYRISCGGLCEDIPGFDLAAPVRMRGTHQASPSCMTRSL